MAREREDRGWSWFEAAAVPDDAATAELCRAFARCFGGPDGDLVVRHLEQLFLHRRLSPEASDAALRHLEGQRSVIAHINAMASRGRS